MEEEICGKKKKKENEKNKKKNLPVEELGKKLKEVHVAQEKLDENIQYVEEKSSEKYVENQVQNSLDEKMEVQLGSRIYNTLNKEEQQKVNPKINTFCENTHTVLSETEYEVNKLNTVLQPNVEIVQESDEKVLDEFCEQQTSEEGNVEVHLDIEVPNNSDFYQELDGKNQEEFDIEKPQIPEGNIKIDLTIEFEANSEFQQELDGKLLEKNDVQEIQSLEEDVQSEFIKNNMRQVNVNVEHGDDKEVTTEVQKKVDYEINVDLEFKKKGQELLEEKQQNTDENKFISFDKEHNGQVLEELYREKQKLESQFENKLQGSSEITQDLLYKMQKEKHPKIDGNFEQEFEEEFIKKYNAELFRNSNKEKSIVKLIADKNKQVESDIRYGLYDKMKCVNNSIKSVDNNLQTEFYHKNISTSKCNTQKEIDRNYQDKFNIGPQPDINGEFNSDVQVQFDKNIKHFNEDCDGDIHLKLELEEQNKIFADIIKTFYKEIQQKIEKLMRDELCGEQNVGDETQQHLNEKALGELKKQIQQEIKDLQKEVDKFDQKQDEELEREIIKEINEMYSLAVQENFLEKLPALLHQESAPYYERVVKLCNTYFPNMCTLGQKCNVKKPTEFEKEIQQNVNKETLPKINNHNVCKENGNGNGEVLQCHNKNITSYEDLERIADKDARLEMCGEMIEVEGKMIVNFEKKLNVVTEKDVHGEIQVIKGNKQYTSEDELYKQFDMVVRLNREIQQNTDEKTQNSSKRRIQVHFNKQLLQKLNENMQQNTQQNKQSDVQSKFCESTQIIFKDACQNINSSIEKKVNNEIDQKLRGEIEQNIEDVNLEFFHELPEDKKREENYQAVKEMELGLDKQILIAAKKQSQQHFEKNIQEEIKNKINLQIEFFKKVEQGVEGECKKKYNDKVQFEKDVDSLKSKKILINNSNKILQEFDQGIENKLQDKSEKDVRIEPELYHEDELKGDDEVFKEGESQKEWNGELQVESEFEREIQEESDVDIEGFEDDQEDLQGELHNKFEGVFKKTFDQQLEQEDDEELVQEIHNETNQFTDINEVVEVVDEFELKTADSVDSFSTGEEMSSLKGSCPIGESTNTEKEYTLENEFSSTGEELSSTEEDLSSKNDFVREIQQKLHRNQFKYNGNVPEFEKESNKDAMEVEYMYEDKIQDETDRVIEKVQQKFKDKSQENMEDSQPELKETNFLEDFENINNLDEIPRELKIQQEQFEEELHQQLKGFQKEFYKNCKQEHDKEQKLKANKTFNPVMYQVYDEQQQLFYELKDEFLEIKEEYRGFVQQKIFEELQREMDEKRLKEIKEFPEQFDDELNLIDEDIHKEFVELQRDCHELEPEFKYNVPLEFEEDNLDQLLKQKPYNLFEKLHQIHKKKLCEFADSDQWPQNVSKTKFI